jgi:hypothetical protein
MSDLVNRLRALADEQYEMLDDIHLPLAEAADRIAQLEAALRAVTQEAAEHHAENVSRATLGGSGMAQRKAKAIVSRSGVFLHNIRFIARAALEEGEKP